VRIDVELSDLGKAVADISAMPVTVARGVEHAADRIATTIKSAYRGRVAARRHFKGGANVSVGYDKMRDPKGLRYEIGPTPGRGGSYQGSLTGIAINRAGTVEIDDLGERMGEDLQAAVDAELGRAW
jgi:hypothetical protein